MILLAALASGAAALAGPLVPRNCPRAKTPEEIVVCANPDGEPESPYRLPIRPDGFDWQGKTDSVYRERMRPLMEGDAGTGSCSTVGGGGWTGCKVHDWKNAAQQKRDNGLLSR